MEYDSKRKADIKRNFLNAIIELEKNIFSCKAKILENNFQNHFNCGTRIDTYLDAVYKQKELFPILEIALNENNFSEVIRIVNLLCNLSNMIRNDSIQLIGELKTGTSVEVNNYH